MSGHDNRGFAGDSRNDSYKSFSEAINSREQLTHRENFPVELRDLKKSLEAGEYDPYLYREVDHPTTNSETLLHLLKGSLGTGILAMPLAFYHSGYLLGLVATTIIGLLCTHCIHLLIKCEYELCKRKKVPVMTYPATAEAALLEGPEFFQKFSSIAPMPSGAAFIVMVVGTILVWLKFSPKLKEVYLSLTRIAFGVKGMVPECITGRRKLGEMVLWFCRVLRHLVNVFLLIYQLGTGTVYTVFIGENIQSVLSAHDIMVDSRLVMLAVLLPLILINYVRNLKYLAPLSTIANFVTMISFGIVAYYMFNEDFTFKGKEAFGSYSDYPLFFGTVLFALEAIGVIMPLENEMKTPQYFGSTFGVLNIGMIAIVFLYASMGFLGYIAYGKDVGGSISYTIGNAIPAQVCKIMLSFSIFITHALQMYPAIDTVWNMYLVPMLGKHQHLLLLEYITRTVMVLFCFGLAVAVPYIDLFISLFGALTLSALGLAIPAILDLSTYWDTLKGLKGIAIIVKNCLIILLGLFGLIVGTSTSLGKIIEKFTIK